MENSTTGKFQTECKDEDGILPIRREAWKLIAPLPSTTGYQSQPNAGVHPPATGNMGNFHHMGGTPLPSAPPPTPYITNQQTNCFMPNDGGQGFPQIPLNPNQNIPFHPMQSGGYFPMMVPNYWYDPCCQQCQQFRYGYYNHSIHGE